jgi:hypothetical protein
MPAMGEKEGVMPKEVIYPEISGDPRLEIGWAKDHGRVQIATLAPDDQTLDPTSEGNGWFTHLTRDDINRTIRALRRARDQAYGADA